jgi:tetratricopeptide (TPR) repeat protein
LPPIPPPGLGLPVINPANTTLPAPVPTPAPGTAGAEDSLEVVQVDLPDNPASTGAELEKQGKYREALQAYIGAVQRDPSDAASWWAMGNIYRKFSQKAYAIQCFEQTLKLKPGNQQLADWLKRYQASNP